MFETGVANIWHIRFGKVSQLASYQTMTISGKNLAYGAAAMRIAKLVTKMMLNTCQIAHVSTWDHCAIISPEAKNIKLVLLNMVNTYFQKKWDTIIPALMKAGYVDKITVICPF